MKDLAQLRAQARASYQEGYAEGFQEGQWLRRVVGFTIFFFGMVTGWSLGEFFQEFVWAMTS